MLHPNYFTCTLGQAAAAVGGGAAPAPPFTDINAFIAAQAARSAGLPAVGFVTPPVDRSGLWRHQLLTFSAVLQRAGHTARALARSLPAVLPPRATVALLCPSTPEFLFAWLGLMRLGHPVLLLAPESSPAGIADLCRQCGVGHVFCDDAYRPLAQSASDVHVLQLHPLPIVAPGAHPSAPHRAHPPLPSPAIGPHDVAYLHHTSGTSSGSPSPIAQSHRAGAGLNARLDGTRHPSFTTTPLYHGGAADLFRAWASDALIWLFPGRDLPITAANIVQCLEVAREATSLPIKYFSSVPYVLQIMAADDRGLGLLQAMDVVGVGGAALPQHVGDLLVRHGVNLVSRFGSSECGFLLSSDRDCASDQEWQYLRLPREEQCLRFEKREGSLHELIVLPGWPHMAKTNRADGSYATGDLFAPHPSISGAWKYHSRADALITLITGKKFDPAPLEGAIVARSKTLQDALVFGSSRPYPGVLLFRSRKARDMPDDELLREIAIGVEELNQEGQKHTHISRNMLVVMPYIDTPLAKSSKGTILRKQAEEKYSHEIEAAYEGDLPNHEHVQDAEIEQFILDFILSIHARPDSPAHPVHLHPQTDLFSFGIDSVACIQIRRAVSKLLPPGAKVLPLTIVQDTGTVEKLAEVIIGLRHGRPHTSPSAQDTARVMADFVRQHARLDTNYSRESGSVPPAPPSTPPHMARAQGKTVLLTGPTGSLGSHLLHQLVSSPHIRHVHLLVRGATREAAEQRVQKALSSKQLAIDAEDAAQISIHRYSLSQPRLGLPSDVYDQLVRDVDVVYHLAWAVDFILPVQGFKQHFAGLQALLELCHRHSRSAPPPARKPAQLIFCSSTASVASYPKLHPREPIPEAIVEDAECSGGIGYSQSKWVAENICHHVVKAYPDMREAVRIVRVGQLSGDSKTGVWNASEAYPLMLGSAKATGCLPDLKNESVAWVPVDVAAKAFLDLAVDGDAGRHTASAARGPAVCHLVRHDQGTTWSMLLKWITDQDHFDVVAPGEWLWRLEQLAPPHHPGRHAHHPSLKLLDFWKAAYGPAEHQQPQPRTESTSPSPSPSRHAYHTSMSLRAMPSLHTMPPVREDYVLKLWKWINANV